MHWKKFVKSTLVTVVLVLGAFFVVFVLSENFRMNHSVPVAYADVDAYVADDADDYVAVFIAEVPGEKVAPEPEPYFYIEQITAIFDDYRGERICRLMPGDVRVVEERGDWLLAYANGEYIWLDTEFSPPVYEIAEFLGRFGNIVSVYYENLASGVSFGHNADRVFFGASATKAPFALYIFEKAERGDTSLDYVFTYTGADYRDGSGVIRRQYSIGATFTQRRLLHLMIAPSDNIATRILRRMHGLEGYHQFIEDLGGDPSFLHNITYSRLNGYEAGFYMREIYRYITSGGRYSEEFKNDLLSNRYPLIFTDYPTASKSGGAPNFGGAFHDMTIVFAPSPFVLAILSAQGGSQADRTMYREISAFVQEFNNTWFR